MKFGVEDYILKMIYIWVCAESFLDYNVMMYKVILHHTHTYIYVKDNDFVLSHLKNKQSVMLYYSNLVCSVKCV